MLGLKPQNRHAYLLTVVANDKQVLFAARSAVTHRRNRDVKIFIHLSPQYCLHSALAAHVPRPVPWDSSPLRLISGVTGSGNGVTLCTV